MPANSQVISNYGLPVFNTPKYREALAEAERGLQNQQFQEVVGVVEDSLNIVPSEDSEHVRLAWVRADLVNSELPDSVILNFARAEYLKWVRQTEYLVLMKHEGLENNVERVAVKASKRGNDVYAKRVRERFSALYALPDIKFFDYKDRSSRHKTGAFFYTLTINPSEMDINEAWITIGERLNRFNSNLRRNYGSFYGLRVYEAQKNGYPHVHGIAVFEEAEFEAFHYNGAWRIAEKRDIEDYWGEGFSDIEAVATTKGAWAYLGKYLGKLHELGSTAKPEYEGQGGGGMAGLVSKASLTTLALQWVYRKRSFSISGRLRDLIEQLHISNCEVPFELLQVDLMGGAEAVAVPEWVLCGFFIGELIKGGRVRWSVPLSVAEFREVRGSGAYVDRLQ